MAEQPYQTSNFFSVKIFVLVIIKNENFEQKIESCNVYFIHKLDNATSRLNETETKSTQSDENPLINLKPIMNYLFKQGDLMDLDLSDEVKPQSINRIK